ncbi:MAG TPA: AAA family ATPase, partial [Jiangellaceae bacterium]|nr:AAA family ATPase [Jiangellaceae bacterium]
MTTMVRAVVAPALIGRDDQLAELHAAYSRVAAGHSEVILLGGEAGIGKTTLVENFATSVSGRAAGRDTGRDAEGAARVLTGQCVELGGEGLPYVPVTAAIRDLLRQVGQDEICTWIGAGTDALAELVPELGGTAQPDPFGRTRLFEVVTTLLERASEGQPLVLVLEDLHWADTSSRDLLQFVF